MENLKFIYANIFYLIFNNILAPVKLYRPAGIFNFLGFEDSSKYSTLQRY